MTIVPGVFGLSIMELIWLDSPPTFANKEMPFPEGDWYLTRPILL